MASRSTPRASPSTTACWGPEIPTPRSGAWLPALATLALAPVPAWAQAQLLEDLRTSASAAYAAEPAELAGFAGRAYFSAQDEVHGRELWSSDGTAAGTALLRDIVPGLDSSNPRELTPAGGTLFFVVCPDAACRLWATDGSGAGTRLVGGPPDPRELTAVGGTLFFVAGADLWSSDGTPGGTAVVVSALAPEALIAVQAQLFFGNQSGELWSSDGTPGGTQPVATDFVCEALAAGGCLPLLEGAVARGSTLFFRASDAVSGAELWSSDGTPGGTARVADVHPGASSSGPLGLTVVGASVFFTADDGSHGRELWISDGTGAGTHLVADLAPGATATTFGELAASNGRLFFVADARLFASDGTEAGTGEVAPAPGGPTQVSMLTDLGGVLLFRGLASTWGLWRSDGSAGGTTLVASIDTACSNAFVATSCPRAVAGGLLYLGADDGTNGREAWASDGTGGGTLALTDLGRISSDPSPAVALAGAAYFFATDDAGQRLLWRSDASAGGTQPVSGPLLEPRALTAAGPRLFFAAGAGGRTLFVSDGAGTKPLLAFGGVPGWAGLSDLVAAGDRLYFVGTDLANGAEPWTSDGTPAGTRLVKDVRTGGAGSSPAELTALGATLLFTADDGTSGRELWRSDGTAAGTLRVADIVPGPGSSAPHGLRASGGRVFFAATTASQGEELWRSDGTEAGTQLVADLAAGAPSSSPASLTDVAGLLFFTAAGHLWRTDGSGAGTLDLADLTGRSPGGLAAAGGRLYFAADDAATGRELWGSDGSVAGTGPIADLAPGPDGSRPRALGDVAGTLLLSATDASGTELWASDGTAAGTLPLLDIFPGPEPSSPGAICAIPGGAVFAAHDGVHGREPWSLETADLSLTVSESADPVGPGIDVTYVATVRNAGPRPTTGVTLEDVLPGGAVLVAVTPGAPACAVAGGVLTCALGALAPGQQASVTLTAHSFVRGTAVHAFSVGSDRFDHRPADDALGVQTTVAVPVASVRDTTALEKPWRTSAAFLVTLSWPTREVVSLDFTTADGTAVAGQDYAARSGTLRLAPGATHASARVIVRPDRLKEGDETFQLLLTGAANAAIGDGTASGRILDDDTRR